MFKKLKVTIGKNEESKLKPKTGNQESSSWSGFSSVSPNINDSQFCIDDETDDTSKDSPARVAVSESTTVDLNKFNQSSSSLVIDNHSSFHTDLESASEFDDNVSVVSEYANDINKGNLYAAYKKLFGRYYKNKNKYLELNSKFKQMLLTHDKDKITMTKAQDKLLQRIVELKEQCTLEQAAKAHMEEALRNDIEERDHIISTLNTKIDLLKKKDENDESDTSLSDVIELQEKCKKLNNELLSSKSECDLLQKQIETLKKSEENTLLTLAENKKEIHKELELKEDQIKKLEKIINGLQMENKILSKGNMVESFSNPNQIKIEKNLQQEISNKISDIEGEMALLFKQKENKVKELEKKIELLEQQLEVNSKLNKEYNYKDKEVEKLKSELALLEQNLNDEKLSSTKKIDTFIKEIGEKSQIIKKLLSDLKDFSKNKIDNENSEKQVLNLRNDVNRIQKLLDDKSVIISSLEKQCINIDELKSEVELKEKVIMAQENKIKHLEEIISDKKCDEKINLSETKLMGKIEELDYHKSKTEVRDESIKDFEVHLDRLKELELNIKEKDNIQKIKNDAEEIKKKMTTDSKNNEEMNKIKLQLNEKTDKINILNSQLESVKEELRLLKLSKLEDEKNICKTLQNNWLEKMEQQKLNLEEEAKKQMQLLFEEIDTLKVIIEGLSKEEKVKDEQLHQLNEKIKHLEEKCIEKSEMIEGIQVSNNNLNEKNKELDSQKNILENEIKKLKATIKENNDLILELNEKINRNNEIIQKSNNDKKDNDTELKHKMEEIIILNEEVKKLKNYLNIAENLTSNLKNEMGELKLKNNILKKSEEELKLQIIEHDKSNKKLQEIIKVVQDEKEQETNTMKKMIEQNQREFDNLNSLHKEMLTQLNQDKFNKISEERTIESVVRDFSLLTEENSFLKKERQKMILVVQDILKNTKKDVFNLKSYIFNQLTEWFSIFERDIISLKSEYTKNIKYFNDNLEDSRDKIVLIKKSFHILKTDFAQIINLFNNNVLEKSIENIITEVYKYNEKLEKKKHELIELQNEFDDFKKNEQIAVKSDMINTLHDLQEKLNAQIKTISDLKNEHENYKAVEKKKWTDKLVETENKWFEKMDNYKKMMDTSHREEIDALTGEWNNERKHQAELNISEKKHDEDLEKIVLNVETSSQREEVLQRQVNKLNKELSEIKKMFRNEFHNKSNTNEEDENIEKSYVEMEFLRNILYEYMMGKQPMVLAKVLAAIVKFDTEQLKSVLQKEEQKVSLLKTLGLS